MCPMARSLRDIYNEHVKIEKNGKMANLFTQARSTCLPRPGLPVYPGLVYLFTQAWSTCLPRPGQPVYPGLDFFEIWKHPRKHSFCMDFVI